MCSTYGALWAPIESGGRSEGPPGAILLAHLPRLVLTDSWGYCAPLGTVETVIYYPCFKDKKKVLTTGEKEKAHVKPAIGSDIEGPWGCSADSWM